MAAQSNKPRQREEERVGERGKGGVNCCERKHRPYPPAKNSSADKSRETHIHKHTQPGKREGTACWEGKNERKLDSFIKLLTTP